MQDTEIEAIGAILVGLKCGKWLNEITDLYITGLFAPIILSCENMTSVTEILKMDTLHK